MKTIRLLLHSFVLATINIVSILLGFGIYYLIRPVNQRAIQAPAAAIISIGAFLLWNLLIRGVSLQKLRLLGKSELAGTWFLTLLWSPILFIPLHYLGRGYLTSFANIWSLWVFQIPTNFLVLLIVYQRTKNDKY